MFNHWLEDDEDEYGTPLFRHWLEDEPQEVRPVKPSKEDDNTASS